MDSFHFPEIVDLCEPSGTVLKGTKRNGVSYERKSNASRYLNKTGKRRLHNSEKSRGKRTNHEHTLHKTSLNSGKKSLKAFKQFDPIGLPKISPNIVKEEAKSKGTAKKCKRSKQAEGDTISYIYSKSLLDENTMAFLRNMMDVDRDGNHLVNKDINRSNLIEHKKPYGLPALKIPEGIRQEEIVEKDFHLRESETESLLNAWETLDDQWSNGSTTNNSISSEGPSN